MAAPDRLVKYEFKTLDLPHTYWDDAAGKKLYGKTWFRISKLVILNKIKYSRGLVQTCFSNLNPHSIESLNLMNLETCRI